MTTITGTAGKRSHGEMARAWTLWACWSSTPQLTAGGRSPSPRNESEGSLMTMAGGGSGVAGVMWVLDDGTLWITLMRDPPPPAGFGGIADTSFPSERKQPRA